MNGKFLAALAGGVAAGFLAGMPIVGWLWFIWAILGGLLAVYLYYRNAGAAIEIIDGVIVGGLAGLTAAIVNMVEVVFFAAIGALISALTNPGASEDKLAAFGVAFMFSMVGVIFNIVWGVLMLFLSLLSGLVLALILNNSNKPRQPVPFGAPGNY